MREADTMPMPNGSLRRAPLIAGLTAVSGGGALLLARRRSRRRKRERLAERAMSAAARRARRVGEGLPDLQHQLASRVSKAMENERWKVWAGAAAGLMWLLIRMGELRQLRRINRTLIARA